MEDKKYFYKFTNKEFPNVIYFSHTDNEMLAWNSLKTVLTSHITIKSPPRRVLVVSKLIELGIYRGGGHYPVTYINKEVQAHKPIEDSWIVKRSEVAISRQEFRNMMESRISLERVPGTLINSKA